MGYKKVYSRIVLVKLRESMRLPVSDFFGSCFLGCEFAQNLLAVEI